MKQIEFRILSSLLLLGSIPLFAGSVQSVRGAPCLPCEEPSCIEPDPCATCSRVRNCHGPAWVITPKGGPCVSRGMDTHITTEFIYWTAREDQLSFAVKQPFNEDFSALEGRVSQPNWEYSPGFKVGLGILYDHDGWDIYANYTWLRPRTSKKTVRADGNDALILRSFGNSNSPDSFRSLSASWSLDFNTVDLELGRNFFISRCLKLRPHFGMKGTWQKQDFPIKGVLSPDGISFLEYTNKLDYWGVGIRTGLDSSWQFSPCLSAIGEVAISALWEGYKTKRKVVSAELLLTEVDFTSECHRINPVLELLLGMRWETWFCCDAYHFAIDGGWEIQWWNDQNHFSTIQGPDLLGDLYLQGFTLKFRFDF